MIKLKNILETYSTKKLSRNFKNNLISSSILFIMKYDARTNGVIVANILDDNNEEYKIIAFDDDTDEFHYGLKQKTKYLYQFNTLQDLNSILKLKINKSIEQKIKKLFNDYYGD